MGPKKGGYYAVGKGRQPGVYTTWDETRAQVEGYPQAAHKKFSSFQEAQCFVQSHVPGWAPRGRAGPGSSGAQSSRQQPQAGPSRTRHGQPHGRAGAADYQQLRPQGKVLGSKRAAEDPGSLVGGALSSRRVYCDGSALGNGKYGACAGIGVFWGHEPGSPNLSERLPGKLQTNNRAEMYAVARILETDPTPQLPLTICSDSQYTISVFSAWITKWARNNWHTSTGPVANKDLIIYIIALLNARLPPGQGKRKPNVSFQKVLAHSGIDGNEQADVFAKRGAQQSAVPERDYERAARELERAKKLEPAKLELDFEIDADDLLSEDEMRRLSETQDF